MVLAEEYNGVQVVRVEPGSPAFKCKDLQQGNILVSVGGGGGGRGAGGETRKLPARRSLPIEARRGRKAMEPQWTEQRRVREEFIERW